MTETHEDMCGVAQLIKTNEPYPWLTITQTDSWKAGNCYYKSAWVVRSVHQLSIADLHGWVKTFINPGQEYRVKTSPNDGEIVGYYQTNKDEARGWLPRGFYEYHIETGIDSSG